MNMWIVTIKVLTMNICLVKHKKLEIKSYGEKKSQFE